MAKALVSVSGGKCKVDTKRYEKIYEKANNAILRSLTKTPNKYLPVDKKDLALKISDSLFYPDGKNKTEEKFKNICSAVTKKLSTKAALKVYLKAAKDGLLDTKAAEHEGFFMANVQAKAQCLESWKDGLYYYTGSPKCKDITNISNDYEIPVAMYLSHLNYENALNLLYDPKDKYHFINGYEVPGLKLNGESVMAPISCTGPKGEKATYNFPYESDLWDLRFVIGTGSLKSKGHETSYWYLLPECTRDGTTLKEDKLLFSFGSRIFIGIDVNLNGQREERALVISYMASTTDMGGIIRSKFMDKAPAGFFNGERAKQIFLHLRTK